MAKDRYYRFSKYLREKFGDRVHKVSINAFFSCPNRDGTKSKEGCIFCDNRSFSPKIENLPIEKQIEQGIEYGKRRYKAKKFIVYFQTYTNTYGEIKEMKEKYDTIKKFKDVIGISIGTRPDCIDEDKLNLIESYTKNYEVWIEYGLQSIHDKTLKLINRNHTYSDFLKAIDLTKNRNIKICAHVIIGLPGETEQDILETAKECAKLKLDGIKIHPLHIIKGTKLHKFYNEGKYIPMEIEEYVNICCKFLEYLYPETIIQRLTADCHKEFLIAPWWINQKENLIKKIEEKMEKNDSWQGKNEKRI